MNQDADSKQVIYSILLEENGKVVHNMRNYLHKNNCGIVIECEDEAFPIFSQLYRRYKSFIFTPNITYFASFIDETEAIDWLYAAT